MSGIGFSTGKLIELINEYNQTDLVVENLSVQPARAAGVIWIYIQASGTLQHDIGLGEPECVSGRVKPISALSQASVKHVALRVCKGLERLELEIRQKRFDRVQEARYNQVEDEEQHVLAAAVEERLLRDAYLLIPDLPSLHPGDLAEFHNVRRQELRILLSEIAERDTDLQTLYETPGRTDDTISHLIWLITDLEKMNLIVAKSAYEDICINPCPKKGYARQLNDALKAAASVAIMPIWNLDLN